MVVHGIRIWCAVALRMSSMGEGDRFGLISKSYQHARKEVEDDGEDQNIPRDQEN